MWTDGCKSIAVAALLVLAILTTSTAKVEAQTASRVALLGTVLAEQGERPIAGAQVELVGNGNMTTTDSSGVFALWDILPGRYRLLIRALGFAPLDIPLVVPDDGLDALEVLLPPTLGRVEVKAGGVPREAHLRGFDQRRRWGWGRFMDSTRLHAYGPMQWATQLTTNTPFLRIVRFESIYGSGYTFAGRRRGAISLRGDVRSECYPHIIVDNVVMYANGIGESPLDIGFLTGGPPVVASEYYSAAQVPAEFDKGGQAVCGALVLWTQR
ncbi:MAG TPA: carboxypeptidase-like regulatory domain-containing protein [Gemmatimonas aurantiaca]|uniref:Carboxypeptidase-like regulatory domain-containing protein n=2 Tax=Gemmatimonas aurantiaca TaxID=173480 RepID=C1A7F0_GEMAT|nr:carboxypeptidase regulatory-like domain-containing protein [Gemmatimonas aurantiaca]BAH38160.1 hypothetical protein GAU_1118 [Gemmatimonas aurantiaca T-27]HCT56933.1 carboxypeptidase-like regulatory domain-containing protein [Gemmatimonas aurantiaca]